MEVTRDVYTEEQQYTQRNDEVVTTYKPASTVNYQ